MSPYFSLSFLSCISSLKFSDLPRKKTRLAWNSFKTVWLPHVSLITCLKSEWPTAVWITNNFLVSGLQYCLSAFMITFSLPSSVGMCSKWIILSSICSNLIISVHSLWSLVEFESQLRNSFWAIASVGSLGTLCDTRDDPVDKAYFRIIFQTGIVLIIAISFLFR